MLCSYGEREGEDLLHHHALQETSYVTFLTRGFLFENLSRPFCLESAKRQTVMCDCISVACSIRPYWTSMRLPFFRPDGGTFFVLYTLPKPNHTLLLSTWPPTSLSQSTRCTRVTTFLVYRKAVAAAFALGGIGMSIEQGGEEVISYFSSPSLLPISASSSLSVLHRFLMLQLPAYI